MFRKKSLGQHFLRDPRILGKIADAANISRSDVILEVGPGEGTLTALLLERAGKVIAVEKDDRLIPVLQQKFAADISVGKLQLVHGDILTLPTNYVLLTTHYKVVANLPYYITGQFLRKFLEETDHPPVSMTVLLQREVAKRIVASDGKESLLSISVKAYGTPRYVDTVKAGSFSPPPKVDSAILTIENISKIFFAEAPEAAFFAVLKKGFAHPRKLLSSNLGVDPEVLSVCGIEKKARPETVPLEKWGALVTAMCRSQG